MCGKRLTDHLFGHCGNGHDGTAIVAGCGHYVIHDDAIRVGWQRVDAKGRADQLSAVVADRLALLSDGPSLHRALPMAFKFALEAAYLLRIQVLPSRNRRQSADPINLKGLIAVAMDRGGEIGS
jgi:hypothetical protein